MPLKYKLKLPRDFNMLTMVGRKTGAFKDQRNGRGGARNDQNDLLAELDKESSNTQETDNDEES